MSEEPVRYPCPRCGESVVDIAQQCFRCRADLLVSLVITKPLADQRGVYAAAKALCDQFPNLKFAEVRDALQGNAPVMLANTTRSVAAWIGETLDGYDVGHTTRWNEDKKTGSAAGTWIALGTVLVLMAAAALFMSKRGDASAMWPWSKPAAQAAAPPTAATPKPAAVTTRSLAASIVPATATVLCGPSQGSGFFVAPDRLVTNQHVLCKPDEGSPMVVLEDGRRLPATIVHAEERLDAAVLYVAGADAKPLPLGDATSVQRGDKAYVVGAPLGMSFTMSEGIVSHPHRRSTALSYVQLDLSITRGNSGGPLVNEQGEVIGLVTYKVGSDATIGLALAINHIYTGDKPLIPAPAKYNSAEWETELQAAWQDDEKARKDMKERARKPMLLRARHDGAKYFAAVAYTGDLRPPSHVGFAILLDGQARCDVEGIAVERWRVVGNTNHAGEDVPPSVRTWLEMNKLESKVHVGIASFQATQCPNQAFTSTGLLLKEGMTGYDRIAFGDDQEE